MLSTFQRTATAGLLTLLLVGAAAGIYVWRRPSLPAPPYVEANELEPEVRSAIDQARVAVKQSPRSARSWGQLGMVYLAHNFLIEAATCFEQAGRLDLKDARWAYYTGIALIPKDPPAAVVPLQRAVDLCKGRLDAVRLRLASLLLTLGRSDDAEQQFQHLLEEDRSHAGAHLGLARIAVEKNDLPECRTHLQQCTTNPATRKAAHQLLAAVAQRQSDSKTADRQLRLAEKLPDDVDWPDPFLEEVDDQRVDRVARIRRCQILMRRERLAEAIAGLTQLAETYPDWDLAWQTLGAALTQHREYAAAEQALNRALKLAPQAMEAYFFLGNAAMFQGKYPEAIAAYRKAIELKPDHALSHDNMARCLAIQGDRAGAIEAFRNALRFKPYLADSHRLLGVLLAQDGKRALALEQLRLAVDLDPDDARAKKSLEQVQGGSGGAGSSR